jgi:signal peptidase I
MEPTLTGGDIIITTPVDDVDELSKGDIIAFKDPSRGVTVTHRVVSVGGNSVQTKGDAYDRSDPWLVPEENVKGEMTYKVPTGALFPNSW